MPVDPLHRKLLNTALDLFQTEGFADVDAERIAKEAGCSLDALYARFPRKEAFVMGLFERIAEQLQEVSADAPGGTVAERFQFLMRHLLLRLKPYRELLRCLTPVLLDPANRLGVLGQSTDRVRARLFFRHAAAAFLQPAVDLTRRWLASRRRDEPFDLWADLVELTLAISSQAIFGEDYLPAWVTGREDRQTERILASYDAAMAHVARQNFSLTPLPDWIPTPSNRRYRRAVQTLDDALARSVKSRRDGNGKGGFLDVLLAEHWTDPDRLGLRQVRDQALVLLLGGYESTATALCWTILLLGEHESVRQALQEEIRRSRTATCPLDEQVRRLKYTAMVFSESLRLYPPPWLIPRTAARDDVLPGGQRIRRGSQLFLSPYRTQRDPAWFDDPLRFDPQRFHPECGAAIRPGSYFPFGSGPRHCLGETIARAQVSLILATLYQDHRIQLASGSMPRPDPLLTLRPRLPVPVYLAECERQRVHLANKES